PRRLVAQGDRVYVTLGLDDPISLLDAATGETVATYQRPIGWQAHRPARRVGRSVMEEPAPGCKTRSRYE
ncbi:MAG: hypothetical protein ACYTBS_23605, partial [Planctomycetota bacterium]